MNNRFDNFLEAAKLKHASSIFVTNIKSPSLSNIGCIKPYREAGNFRFINSITKKTFSFVLVRYFVALIITPVCPCKY